MNLKYHVLWIDNEMAELKATITLLKKSLPRHGLELIVEELPGLDSDSLHKLSAELSISCKYDLLVIDSNLGASSENGDEIAKEMRSKIYTDMIFYSADSPTTLCAKLCKLSVGGVYTAARTELREEVEFMVLNHTKRWARLDSFRGLLLSQIAEIESLLRLRLVKELADSESENTNARKKYVKKRKADCEDTLNNLEDFPTGVEIFSDYQLTDFNAVRCRLKTLLNDDDELKALIDDGGDVERYQKMRNAFAHQKTEIADEGRAKLVDCTVEYDISRLQEEGVNLFKLRSKLDGLL